MNALTLPAALVWAQTAIGLAIMLGGLVILVASVDRYTARLTRWPLIGLVPWGAWLSLSAWSRGADSLPALAFSLLVAYVLVRYGRQVRGIIDGETWWPPNGAAPVYVMVHMDKRRTIAPGRKRSLRWLLIENEDDGLYGDAAFNPEGRRDWRTALRWWLRNPFHNLTFYVIGVADLDRMVEGPLAPRIENPAGGWLWCRTHVVRGGRPRRLPFVSYVGAVAGVTVKAYAGWRPGGAFGLKLQLRKGAA